MKPEKQRIAIAEACGWKPGKCPCGEELCNAWKTPAGDNWEYVPDYLNDLNDMHEAEKTLNDEQRAKFVMTLHFSTDGDLTASLENPRDRALYVFPVLHATAAQRAEAFLRTVGKWEGDK
jgi:hypothetical protein